MQFTVKGEFSQSIRIFFILLVFAVVLGFFLFRLFVYQVVKYDEYVLAAESQSTSTNIQQAQRGQIVARDRDGKIYTLAASNEEYNLMVAPTQVRNKSNLAKILSELLPELDEETVFERINVDRVYIPTLLPGLSRQQADLVVEQNLSGVYLEPRLVRVYPEADAIAAQVIGYVDAGGRGQSGVEMTFDSVLRGVAGSQTAKQDSFGRLIDVIGGSSPRNGQDLLLTLDYNLQFFVERRLRDALDEFKADGASAIVMDAKTGAILAVAGQPTFDPNRFSEYAAVDHSIFLSPAASNAYESGSVIKTITMAMAIDQELVEPDTTEVFGPSINVGGFEIRNSDNKVFGRETMTQVLENSDNVAMVWLSQKLGVDKQYDYLRKFGFGKRVGIGLNGESSGILREQKDWSASDSATASYGHGFSVTLTQLASAYAVIANDGKSVQPHLVEGTIERGVVTPLESEVKSERIIKSSTSGKILNMLESVVVNGHGKRAAVEGIRVGGKTGTAQVPSPTGGYKENELIGTFAGMFPLDDPRFVVVVRFDNPRTVRFAESSAAPVFGRIAEWMTNYYRLR